MKTIGVMYPDLQAGNRCTDITMALKSGNKFKQEASDRAVSENTPAITSYHIRFQLKNFSLCISTVLLPYLKFQQIFAGNKSCAF